MIRLLVVLAATVLLVGCGGTEVTAADLERQIPAKIAQGGDGKLTGVTCVKRSDTDFRCAGNLRLSHAATARSVDGIDTSDWTESDWRAMGEGRSVPLVLDVTVDQDTGRWVSTPVGQ